MASGPRRRLFRKYVVIVVGLVTVTVVGSSAVEASFAFRENKAELVQVQRGKATAAAGAIQDFMGEIERDMSTALHPGVVDDASMQRRYSDFIRILRQVDSLTELAYIDPAGIERIRHSRDMPDFVGRGPDRSSDPAFVRAREGHPYFSRVFFVQDSEPHMTIALREGAAGGVVVGDLTLKLIRNVITQIKVGKEGYAYAVDSNGDLILDRDVTLILKRTNLSGLPQVKAALSSGTGAGPRSSETTEGTGLSGGRVLTVEQAIPELGWYVFVEQPLGVALAPLYAAILRTVLLLVVGLVAAVLASLVLARKMVTPIETLRAGAERIGGGDLDHHIEIRTGDELQQLAGDFNRMTDQLRSSYAELEQRVADRTRDLAAAMNQLEEKGQELETVSRHKSEFLANMSHELRTPLNAIIGFSEVLHEQMFGELNEQQLGYVGDVLDAGRHLLSLINDILDLSKVEAGRMELELADVSLPETLQSGLTMNSERATRGGIALGLRVDPDDIVVQADERKLRQVVFNLLSNALKFTPAGGRVDVSAQMTDGVVEVAVADTGSGISPEDQELIFEEFQQARGGDAGTRQEGTGLGLPLSRRFIELHGGRLWVESTPGQGSTFR
ncbi:MAG TPA: ATP-binding protein, partial [Actinomycetota bacterium]